MPLTQRGFVPGRARTDTPKDALALAGWHTERHSDAVTTPCVGRSSAS